MKDTKKNIDRVIELLKTKSPLAAKKAMRNLKLVDDRHQFFTEFYFSKYIKYLDTLKRSIEFGVDCYVSLTNDMISLRNDFLQTGRYANKSFDEVNRVVYSNPRVMEYHMHGLLLAQFIWHDQYKRFTFFHDNLKHYLPINKYLEIGGGHGIYIHDATTQLSDKCVFDLVDISESSLNLAKGILEDKQVNFLLQDVFDFSPTYTYDFITIGEVIEHLESPVSMLNRLRELLSESGTVFLTTPVNAPMIDHIYLFNNVEEIRLLIRISGFRIDKEIAVISEEVSEEVASELKIPIMYAAFLKRMY